MSADPELARAIVAAAKTATLATIALRPAGYPYASLVDVAADDAGRPLLLLSSLAEHTKNLGADPRVSLLFADASRSLEKPRVTVLGACRAVIGDDVRDRYLAAHPDAARYAGFADFAFYRLEPEEVRLVAGFGRMSWIDAAAFARA